MSNYKVLFSLKVLKSVLHHFVDIFLTLYFLDVSSSNILPLGIYKLVVSTAIFGIMFLARNYCKSKHRVNLIKKEYKVEYWLGVEGSLFIGRVISNILFILMAFTGANLMMYIFVVFLIMYASNSIKLQKVIGEI